MRKSVIGIGCLYTLVLSIPAFAQYGADIFRYSEINQTGSARFQALGGNHAALGADPSNISGNPAGLGFYNRSEFTLSPSLVASNTDASYINNVNSVSNRKFNFAQQASLVIASKPGFERKWRRSSFGISFSQQQSFREEYNYSGLNTRSAYLNQVVEGVNRLGTTTAQLENDYDPGSNGAGPLAYSLPAAYYQMYLINPTTASGPPYIALDNTSATNQTGRYSATGANSQWNLSYGGNYDDKLYVGGTFSFSKIRYDYSRSFWDDYVNSPELINIDQNESLTVNGNGINLTAGVIYKFNPVFQVGGAITSPTWGSIKETFNQSVEAVYVDGQVTGPDGDLIDAPFIGPLYIAPNDFVYSMSGPLRASFGATFFVKNSGFITGSVEYVGYGAMSARTSYLDSNGNSAFKNETKNEVKDTYRNTVNLKIGGEYRAGKFRARVGAAYNADPYLQQGNIDRSRLLLSAGAGVRSDRFFVDLSGTLSKSRSFYTPYYLNNVQDFSSVDIAKKTVNVVLTGGVFF